MRYRLVRDIEGAVACPITRQEQPAGKPLIYIVEMVAGDRLHKLFVQNMGVTLQGWVNLALLLYRRLQNPRANPKRFACDLHLSAEQRLVFCHDF
jgi:hypothetical protein